MLLPEIYMYILIIFGIIFLAISLFYINNRRKKQTLRLVYRKLSDSDKQTFHVVRATEKRSVPTIQNILSVFYSINGLKIETDQIMQRLYRLENVGLVNISVSNRKSQAAQICTTLYSDSAIAEIISQRYRFFSGLFLPLSIISLGICYYLLQFVDLIVHGDLYGYGLVFSYDWANQYWNITASMRISLTIAFFLLGISLMLTIVNFRSFKNILKITNCTIFIIGIAIVSYIAFLLSRLDFIVNNDLYFFGLQFSSQWAEKYWSYIGLLYFLIGLSIVAILICFIFCIYAKAIDQNN